MFCLPRTNGDDVHPENVDDRGSRVDGDANDDAWSTAIPRRRAHADDAHHVRARGHDPVPYGYVHEHAAR